MGKMLVVVMVVLAMCSVALADDQAKGNPGIVRTATIMDLDGTPVQFQDVAFADTWRQNRYHGRIVKLVSNELRFPDKPWDAKANPYIVKSKTIDTFNSAGNGLARDATVGFISNVPIAAGLGFGLWKQNVSDPNQQTQFNNGGNTGPVTNQQLQGQIGINAQQQGQTTGACSPVIGF